MGAVARSKAGTRLHMNVGCGLTSKVTAIIGIELGEFLPSRVERLRDGRFLFVGRLSGAQHQQPAAAVERVRRTRVHGDTHSQAN